MGIKQDIEGDRGYISSRGNQLNQAAKDRGDNDLLRYGSQVARADQAYEPLIDGYGGYSEAERADIIRDNELRAARTPEGQLKDNYLRPDEEAAIMGDPNSRYDYFDPQMMTERGRDKEKQTDAIIGTMKEGMYNGITPGLSPSAGYYDQMDEAVSGTEDWLTDQADADALRASEETLDAVRMSPEEEARMVASAGKTAGNAYRAQLQQVDRSSRAAGADSQGVAARRLRYTRQSAIDAADAATNAKVMASNARSGRAGQAEYIRQSGEGSATDLATRQGFGIGGMKMDKTQTAESTRRASERDVSNRRMDTAQTLGQAGVNAKFGHLAAQQGQLQYNAGLGTEIATGVDRDQSNRSAYISGNRQGVNQGNQATAYGQKLNETELLSGRHTQVADTRLDAGREGRGYVREQIGVATNREANERNTQSGVYNTQTRGRLGTTGQAITYDRTPGTAERIIGTAIGGARAVLPFIPGLGKGVNSDGT
jgi:hypothetical protein